MNTYELIMNRRSVRNFKDQPIPEAIISQLIDAANNAPSGGNIQPVSIILIQDKENRAILSEMVGNQPWVKNAPLSMIFCLDFNRIKRWAYLNQTEFKGEQAFSHFLIAYADVMCAAQSVVVLAESLGLGSVYVGTIQSQMDEARERYAIPDYVLPLMILSLGYPKSIPRTIPKLEPEVIVHYEQYQAREDGEIQQAFNQKYGNFNIKAEEYLEKAFIETIEADKQGGEGWTEWAVEQMKKMEIRNDAQFLFNLRYPSHLMVQMNAELIASFKRAGFDFFVEPES